MESKIREIGHRDSRIGTPAAACGTAHSPSSSSGSPPSGRYRPEYRCAPAWATGCDTSRPGCGRSGWLRSRYLPSWKNSHASPCDIVPSADSRDQLIDPLDLAVEVAAVAVVEGSGLGALHPKMVEVDPFPHLALITSRMMRAFLGHRRSKQMMLARFEAPRSGSSARLRVRLAGHVVDAADDEQRPPLLFQRHVVIEQQRLVHFEDAARCSRPAPGSGSSSSSGRRRERSSAILHDPRVLAAASLAGIDHERTFDNAL